MDHDDQIVSEKMSLSRKDNADQLSSDFGMCVCVGVLGEQLQEDVGEGLRCVGA